VDLLLELLQLRLDLQDLLLGLEQVGLDPCNACRL
jgi:hypothetical protein